MGTDEVGREPGLHDELVELRERVWTLLAERRAAEARAACNKLLSRCEEFAPSDDFAASLAADALWLRGRAAKLEGAVEQQLGDLSELVTRFGSSDSPELRERVSVALLDQVWLYTETARAKDAIATSARASRHFADTADSNITTKHGESVIRISQSLVIAHVYASRLGYSMAEKTALLEAAAALLTGISYRLKQAEEPWLVDLRARAQVRLPIVLARLRRRLAAAKAYHETLGLGEPAVAAYNELLGQLDRGTGIWGVQPPYFALFAKARILADQGRFSEARQALGEVIERLSADRSLRGVIYWTVASLEKSSVSRQVRRGYPAQ